MKPKIAPVKNITTLREAFAAVDQPDAPEKMVLVHGDAGFGKTTAIAWLMSRTNAIVVRADQTWSVHSMLRGCLAKINHVKSTPP